MKILIFIFSLASVHANKDFKAVIGEEYFPEQLTVYKSDHDIVRLLLPINYYNKLEGKELIEKRPVAPIFFVEADILPDGKKGYLGLYILKTDKPEKLLDNGKDMAAPSDGDIVYLAASDGVYTYDRVKNQVEKYGTNNDDIIYIEKESGGDGMYILTANKEVFKVTNNGTNKQKLEDAVDEIVMDYENNLYFAKGKNVYIRTKDGVKEANGLPENITSFRFMRPDLTHGVHCIINDKLYTIRDDGSCVADEIKFKETFRPTAVSAESRYVVYFATHKKIYEHNFYTFLITST